MAIEKVYMYNNTSIIQDEVAVYMHVNTMVNYHNNIILVHLLFQVLAHRLGLIPLKVDPRKFEMMPSCKTHSSILSMSTKLCVLSVEEEVTFPLSSEFSRRMLEFHLKVKCTRNPRAPKGCHNDDDLYVHSRGMFNMSL